MLTLMPSPCAQRYLPFPVLLPLVVVGVHTGTRDVVGEFGGVCMPNSPVPLAKTILETLAACKKWCKINGAPDLEWRDIDLSPNPVEVTT